MITALILVFVLILYGYYFLELPKFGKLPLNERLQKIQNSPNYRDGKFQNTSFTPDLAEGASYYSILKEMLFERSKRNKPKDIIPSQKTDLLHLNSDENVLIWFGHSSYFIQIDGKTMLVDPVLSGAASPIKSTTRSFPGTDVYTTDDFPEIDYLFISHDHWDHLDYETVTKLKPKIKTIITGLGTGVHLESWGFDKRAIIEKDWNEQVDLGNGFVVNTVPARHFSGRKFKRNQVLWLSFVLQTPTKKLFLGGDSGYDSHFKKIGEQFGPFDLAILECGQYNKSWKYIHMMPEEMIPAAKDLNAKALMPVHWGKFSLANHAWDEPITLVLEAAETVGLPLITPMIGEKVNLDNPGIFASWWKAVN